jgi:hypothetical protein
MPAVERSASLAAAEVHAVLPFGCLLFAAGARAKRSGKGQEGLYNFL